MEIRHATKHDISAISEVEAKCFPPSEAASEKAFTERIENYGILRNFRVNSKACKSEKMLFPMF